MLLSYVKSPVVDVDVTVVGLVAVVATAVDSVLRGKN